MVPIVSLLLILGASILLIRVAAVALEHTGLGRDVARFQARSAFTGVGFTTTEAEQVVGHPVRRRIVMWLMLVGNVGVMSAMAALLLSAIDLRTQYGAGILVGILAGGLAVLCFLGSSRWVDRHLCRVIRWAIGRWTTLEVHDFARLLHLRDAYGVSRVRVVEGSWLSGRTLRSAGLVEEGVLVLGVECPGGRFVGAPGPDIEIRAGDDIVIYGSSERVSELESRAHGRAGDSAHTEAADERFEQIRKERRLAGR